MSDGADEVLFGQHHPSHYERGVRLVLGREPMNEHNFTKLQYVFNFGLWRYQLPSGERIEPLLKDGRPEVVRWPDGTASINAIRNQPMIDTVYSGDGVPPRQVESVRWMVEIDYRGQSMHIPITDVEIDLPTS